MKIDIITPTRNRVKKLYVFLNSIRDTISDPNNAVLYFYVTPDDEPTIKNIEKIKNDFKELNIIFKIGPRMVLSNHWNALWKISKNEIVMLSNDDIKFITKNWDIKVINEFEKVKDKILLVFAFDGNSNERCASHPFISRKSTNILGYFVPPHFEWGFTDVWLDVIYSAIERRKYLPDMKILHLHFSKFKENIDNTYIEIINKYQKKAIEKWYQTKRERIEDAKKLTPNIEDRFLRIKISIKLFIFNFLYLFDLKFKTIFKRLFNQKKFVKRHYFIKNLKIKLDYKIKQIFFTDRYH